MNFRRYYCEDCGGDPGAVGNDPGRCSCPVVELDPARELVGATVRVAGWSDGIAFRVDGLEAVPDADTEWTGYEVETGRVLVHMIGDDRTYAVEVEDCTTLDGGTWCEDCGQVGCPWHPSEVE